MSKTSRPKTFAGDLVHFVVKDTIKASDSKLPVADAVALTRMRIGRVLADFLLEHFTKTITTEDGDITIQTNVSILVSEVPAGLASTRIAFQEVPK